MITVTEILDCECCLDGMDAVIFDLDDTLYSEKDYLRSGYSAVAACFPQVENMQKKLWQAFEMRLPAIDTVLEHEGITALADKERALRVYRHHMPNLSLYAGVAEMLQRLRKHKKLGLITDGRPEGQRAKIDALGIAAYFDKIIITDELGGPAYRKPNEAAFRLMQQALDVPFCRMVYIGDNTKKDFLAPQSLGMQSIHFRNEDGLYIG